jgi:mRNA interferase RelE/StbE
MESAAAASLMVSTTGKRDSPEQNRASQLPQVSRACLKSFKLGSAPPLRLGDIRIIASIEDQALCILIIKLGHRREIYR